MMTRTKKPIFLLIISLAMLSGLGGQQPVQAQSPIRTVNVPYTSATTNIPVTERAIFWFGQVDPTGNYVDVRTIFNDNELIVMAHIFDNKLWYDATTPIPNQNTLEQWDAVTLYLNTSGASGTMPTAASYKFVGQLNHFQSRAGYQKAWRGDGASWQAANISFTTISGWVGNGINTPSENDRGWWISIKIPFSSLGITKPANGTHWGLAMAVHDRDDAAGTAIPDRVYPETFSATKPGTWATLNFGVPVYSPPLISLEGTTTVRQGLDGATVSDAQVGGSSICGATVDPNYFDSWGNLNYNAATQINIQNQFYVGDWPCFSKFYIEFPLDKIPSGKFIASATLKMYQFGNADSTTDVPQPPEPSYIQVFAVDNSWNESTITWNNAPIAKENVGGAWVNPLPNQFSGWPGEERQWNVSRAVNDAYQRGKSLRLALYSGDNAFHSGKYFSSSDMPDWNAAARPTLTIVWGSLATVKSQVYLPLVLR